MPNSKHIFRASNASRILPSLSITVPNASHARPLVGRCSRRSHTRVLATACATTRRGTQGEGRNTHFLRSLGWMGGWVCGWVACGGCFPRCLDGLPQFAADLFRSELDITTVVPCTRGVSRQPGFFCLRLRHLDSAIYRR